MTNYMETNPKGLPKGMYISLDEKTLKHICLFNQKDLQGIHLKNIAIGKRGVLSRIETSVEIWANGIKDLR